MPLTIEQARARQTVDLHDDQLESLLVATAYEIEEYEGTPAEGEASGLTALRLEVQSGLVKIELTRTGFSQMRSAGVQLTEADYIKAKRKLLYRLKTPSFAF